MPLLAIPTTLSQLEDAFHTALQAMTPRTVRSQGDAWKRFDRDHAPTMGTRWYRFEWDLDSADGDEFMWNGGASQRARLTIIVDYGVPMQARDPLVHDDWNQVWDVLDNLRNTTDGLRRVKGETWGLEEGNEDSASFALVYSVRYLQARAS